MSLRKRLLGTVALTSLAAIAGCQIIGVSEMRGVNEYIEIEHFDDHSETNHVLEVVNKEDYNILGKTGNALYYGIQGISHGFARGLDRYKAYRNTPEDDNDDDSALVEFMETLQSSINCPIDGAHKVVPAIFAGFAAGFDRGWHLHKGDEDDEIIYDYILRKRLQDRDRRRKKMNYKPEVEVRHTSKGGKEIVIDTEYLNDDDVTTEHIIKTMDIYEDIQHKKVKPLQPEHKTKVKLDEEKVDQPEKVTSQTIQTTQLMKYLQPQKYYS